MDSNIIRTSNKIMNRLNNYCKNVINILIIMILTFRLKNADWLGSFGTIITCCMSILMAISSVSSGLVTYISFISFRLSLRDCPNALWSSHFFLRSTSSLVLKYISSTKQISQTSDFGALEMKIKRLITDNNKVP